MISVATAIILWTTTMIIAVITTSAICQPHSVTTKTKKTNLESITQPYVMITAHISIKIAVVTAVILLMMTVMIVTTISLMLTTQSSVTMMVTT